MNQEIVRTWLEDHQPLAIEKLAVKANVSSSLIRKMLNGVAPKHASSRHLISKALGVTEATLFPSTKRAKRRTA